MSHNPEQIYSIYGQDHGQDFFEYMPYCKAVGRGIVLEIGVRGGVSTAAFLLSKAEEVYSVDIDPRCAELYKGHEKWTFIYSDSKDHVTVRSAFPSSIDILFVDGDHSYEGLKADLDNYHDHVKPGGLILVHDVAPWNSAIITQEQIDGGWAGPYTSRAYNEFLGEHPELRSQVLPGKFGLGIIYK